jgi:hypothetical protein
MIFLNVQDNRNPRTQEMETTIRFVGFSDENISGSMMRIAARLSGVRTDGERRIQAQTAKCDGEHRRRAALPVRSGNGDASISVHDLGESLRPMNHMKTMFPSRAQLDIRFPDRLRNYHAGRFKHSLGIVSDMDITADSPQGGNGVRLLSVTTRDARTPLSENFRERGHPGSTDPDEVQPTQIKPGRECCHNEETPFPFNPCMD